MGIFDKAKHEAQNVVGKAKQGVGRTRGDKPLATEGKRDQHMSHLKRAGDHVKDAIRKK